jgi:hypothetical protein
VFPVRHNWTVCTATSSLYLAVVSRLSRQCGILNILQPYRPPRHVTGTALLYRDCLDNVGSLTSHNPIDLHLPVTGIALLYGDGVCFL